MTELMRKPSIAGRIVIVMIMLGGLWVHQEHSQARFVEVFSAHRDMENVFEMIDRTKGQAVVEHRVDPVWHLIPGLNGRQVNRKATKAIWHDRQINWQDDPVDQLPLVWETVEPRKSLHTFRMEPIYRGNIDQPAVSFLINVAWGEEFIQEILEVLANANGYATFFVEGQWALKHPELVKEMVRRGHEVGNHSFSHPQMDRLSFDAQHEQMQKTNAILSPLTGKTIRWFAPPSGAYNKQTLLAATNENMYTILWTSDTVDWKHPPVTQMIAKVENQLGPGVLVLMHPTKESAQALPQLIRIVQERGLKVVGLSEMMDNKRIVGEK